MKNFIKTIKGKMMALLLFSTFICGAFALFGNTTTMVFAQEKSEAHTITNQERGIEDYTGYGCNNGIDLQVNLSEQPENEIPEFIDGFGCKSSCGASREDGYSSTYHSGCRN